MSAPPFKNNRSHYRVFGKFLASTYWNLNTESLKYMHITWDYSFAIDLCALISLNIHYYAKISR